MEMPSTKANYLLSGWGFMTASGIWHINYISRKASERTHFVARKAKVKLSQTAMSIVSRLKISSFTIRSVPIHPFQRNSKTNSIVHGESIIESQTLGHLSESLRIKGTGLLSKAERIKYLVKAMGIAKFKGSGRPI